MSARRLAARLQLGDCLAVPATERSLQAIEEVVSACRDYFGRSAAGLSPDAVAADRLADALADRQRRFFLLRKVGPSGEPVGLLELALDTPDRGRVTVVLLAIAASERRRGLGTQVARALFRRLADEGFASVHLGVARGEPGAAAFWESLGMWPRGRQGGVRLYELPLR